MNKEEYIEMRQEFASLIYNFENFMKNGFLADCKYNVAFYDALREIRQAEMTVAVIAHAMKDKENNETKIDQQKYGNSMYIAGEN